MQKHAVTRIAKFMQGVIPLIGIVTIALYALYWGAGTNEIVFGPDGANNIVIYERAPEPARRLTGLVATAPATLAWLTALAYLFLLFRRVNKRSFVDPTAVRHLRGYTFFAAAAAILDVAGSGARRWSQGEFSNAPLWTHIQISPEHMVLIFTAAIFYFITFILQHAIAYKDEAESYV